jgi:hypothetical protein
MITIFSDFRQFSARKMAFISKNNVMINFFQKLAVVWAKTPYFRQIIWRKYISNHNIGPRSDLCLKFKHTVTGLYPMQLILLWVLTYLVIKASRDYLPGCDVILMCDTTFYWCSDTDLLQLTYIGPLSWMLWHSYIYVCMYVCMNKNGFIYLPLVAANLPEAGFWVKSFQTLYQSWVVL